MNICAKVLGCHATGDGVNFQIEWEAHLPDGQSINTDFTIDPAELGPLTNAKIIDSVKATILDVFGIVIAPADKVTLFGGRV